MRSAMFLILATITCIAAVDPPEPNDVLWRLDLAKYRASLTLPAGASWANDGPGGIPSLHLSRTATTGSLSVDFTSAMNLAAWKGSTVILRYKAKAAAVSKPPSTVSGVKCVAHWISSGSGTQHYVSKTNVYGTFDWTEYSTAFTIDGGAGMGDIYLALEASSGAVAFADVRLVMEHYMPIRPLPPANPPPAYTGHSAPRLRGMMSWNYLSDANFAALAGWNANLVRWQMNCDNPSNKASYESEFKARLGEIDAVLASAKKRGMMVVLDLHTPPGGRTADGTMLITQDKAWQDYFVQCWQRIAATVMASPNRSALWAYDLINEPNSHMYVTPPGVASCMGMQVKAARAVRAIDPTTAISITSDLWGGPDSFDRMYAVDVPNVIYQVHMYDPGTFTHQGVKKALPNPLIGYPGVIDGAYTDINKLREFLKPVRDFQLAYNVHIYVGEFSAVRWAPGADRYLRDCTQIFEEYGWDWTFHAFRESQEWSVEIGENPAVKTVSATETARAKVLKGWFAKNLRTTAAAPVITAQPASRSVITGAVAGFTVVANGNPAPVYQWQRNGISIAGATSATYSTPATTAADSGSAFCCIVSNSAGSVTSATASLTVLVPPTITVQPLSVTTTLGQVATFSVTATGSPAPTYQWQRDGVVIVGATAAAYTTPASVAGDNGATYRCVVANAAGTATSTAATLTLRTAPVITVQPASMAVNLGKTATFSVTATGSPAPAYQWQRNGVLIAGATASTYTTPATAASDTGSTFRCVVSNLAGSATTTTAILTVNSAPVITTQPASITVNVGQVATFSITTSGSATLTYQWQRNGAAIAGATAASYATPTVSLADSGAAYRCVVGNGLGSVTSAAATLTVANRGWSGTYYPAPDFTGAPSSRIDPAIAFAWDAAAPMPAFPAERYTVRWRGLVTPRASEACTFIATCDDGVRVWVDGELVIDHWVTSGAYPVTGQARLTAGSPVPVVMEYYENTGKAQAMLEWQGASLAREVIPSSAVVPATGDDLPGGWSTQDVGTSAFTGSAAEAGGRWTLTGAGNNIWGTADQMRFAWRRVDGDVRITAKVASMSAANAWSKAGVMLRSSLDPGSAHGFTCVTPDNGIAFQRRLAISGATSYTAGPGAAAPCWARLERVGSVVISSASADGITWVEIRRATIELGSSIYAGLAVTGHDSVLVETTVFSDVEIVSASAAAN